MDTTQFLSALLTIVLIDLVLAGDNAIVIALAARGLPAHLQKRAIVWGAVGAIGVRSLMTVIVVWLLKIPGLLAAGGLLLVWIAYRLLKPDEEGEGHEGPTATTFWGAMRTIVIADAVMGLDNVLAVAGAAHGSYVLVVLGLVISVPIVVWGSTVVLKIVDRFPSVMYIGAAVLLWTAVKMVLHEPLLKPWLDMTPALSLIAYLAIPLVLWLGFARNHRQIASSVESRLAAFESRRPAGTRSTGASARATVTPTTPGDKTMLKVLVPVDNSTNSLRAVRHAMDEYQRHHELELHLLNVQPSLSRHIARFVSRQDRDAWHRDQAQAAMMGARSTLDQAKVPYQTHWTVGERAAEICRMASTLGVHHLVMGTARKNSMTRMLEDSVTNRVLESTPVPVEVVAGEAVSAWEKWGIPAGLLGAGGLVLLAMD